MMRLALVVLLAAGIYLAYEFGRIQAGYNVVDVALTHIGKNRERDAT